MGESLICDICGKLATVHLTQIINNKIQKIDLCEECAQKKGVTDPSGFSLADLLSKNIDISAGGGESNSPLVCEQCGFTPQNFKKSGRLGCACCYESLAPVIMPILQNMQRGPQHQGKVPQRVVDRVSVRREMDSLQRKLQDAVSEERYEDAATYRDQLEKLKTSSLETGGQ